MNKDDLVDAVWDVVRTRRPAASSVPSHKRIFLSEYEIKNMVKNEKVLKVPSQAIISPLALDWLAMKRIQIIREGS